MPTKEFAFVDLIPINVWKYAASSSAKGDKDQVLHSNSYFLGDQIIENAYTVATIIDIIPKLGGYSNILIVGALVFTSFNFPCSSCCLKMKASCSCSKTCSSCCKKKKAIEDKFSDEEDQESLSGKKKEKNDQKRQRSKSACSSCCKKKKKPEPGDEEDKDKEAGEEQPDEKKQKEEAAEAKQSKKFKCPCGSKAKSAKPPAVIDNAVPELIVDQKVDIENKEPAVKEEPKIE